MKVKLSDITIDTSKIKKLHNTPRKLYEINIRKAKKYKYYIELENNDCIPINKQEYKLLKNKIGSEKNEK